MVLVTGDIFAFRAESWPGRMARSASEMTADPTADAGWDVAPITDRPIKMRRILESIRGGSEAFFDRWDDEEGDVDAGGDGEREEEDGPSDDESSDGEAKELSEETLLRLERARPDVKSLVVRRIPGSASGEETGSRIGGSAQLKKLTIEGEHIHWRGNPRTMQWFSDFCAGLSGNRSIHHLSLDQCNLDRAPATGAKLSPFLELNSNLRCLDIVSCNIGNEITRLLASALSRRRNKGSVRRINLEANVIGDESGAEFIHALRGYDNLSKLSLGDNEIGRKSCAALGDLLSGPNGNLKELNLENNFIDDDGIARITNALADRDASLRELSLSFNCEITQAGWRTFSACLRNPDSALETLDLSSTNVADEGAIALGTSLVGNETLRNLNLYDLTSRGAPLVTGAGWHGFFACLRGPTSALERLDLRYGSVDEGGLSALTSALVDNSSVKMLDLSHNVRIAPAKWLPFFACLKYPDTAVEELYLCGNNVGDEEMTHLARSLVGNGTLKTLSLDGIPSITGAGWAPFSRLVCDGASIDAIRESNHSLQFLGDRCVPADLDALLRLNEGDDEREAAREKIVERYFENGRANVEEFLDVELNVLPHAVSWIGRDDAGASLLYELLTRLSSLFSSVGKEKASGAKRKRAA